MIVASSDALPSESDHITRTDFFRSCAAIRYTSILECSVVDPVGSCRDLGKQVGTHYLTVVTTPVTTTLNYLHGSYLGTY